MAETALEDRTRIGTQKPSGLEKIVNTGKTALAIGADIAFPFMYYPFAGNPIGSRGNWINSMIVSYPFSIGSRIEDARAGKPVDHVKAAKESFVGALMTPGLAYLFKYIELTRQAVTGYAGVVAGGAAAVGALAVAQAVFIGAYTAINHVIQNFSFKGVYEKLKKDYWPTMKRTWLYVLPLSSLNVLWVYKLGIAAQLVYSSLMSLLFRLVGPKAEGEKEKYKAPTPAMAGANA